MCDGGWLHLIHGATNYCNTNRLPTQPQYYLANCHTHIQIHGQFSIINYPNPRCIFRQWGKLMQTWGQHANSTQKGPDQESSQDLLPCDSANQRTLATSTMHQILLAHPRTVFEHIATIECFFSEVL